MFDITVIETDPVAEIEGIWRPYKDGSKLLIARIGNKKYRSLLRSKVKANRAVLDNEDDLADEVGEEVMTEVYAKTILLGWSGIQINGMDTPYTSAIGLEVLKKSREFRDTVKAYAEDAEAFRKKAEDAAVKN